MGKSVQKKSAHFLMVILACLPSLLWADEDDKKYLAGAVPEVDGKVVFVKEFDLPGVDPNTVYDRMHSWLDSRMKENNNESRIVYADKEKLQIVASDEKYLVFTKNALSMDRSLMNCNIIVLCKPGKCEIQVDRIRFNYEDKKQAAEEMIADNVALNKKKTAIFRGYKKFRTNTVDYVDDLFESARVALGIRHDDASPLVATQSEQAKLLPADKQVDKAPAVNQSVSAATQNVQPTTPIDPQTETPSSLQGYKQISPDKIPGNIIKMLSEDWMLITAGTDEKFNMMTASWGGLGMIFGKPMAICFIIPTRYTYQLMETNDTYTFTFYTEAYRDALNYCGSSSGRDTDKVKGSGLTPITTPLGSKAFSEAWLIIECRKVVAQSLNHDFLYNEKIKAEWTGKQLHKMFIGEIVNVWVK